MFDIRSCGGNTVPGHSHYTYFLFISALFLILQGKARLLYEGQDCNKTWVHPPRNKIFDLEHPMYNGGRYSHLYRKQKPVRSISFGDSTISEHDTHREDRPSSSALPPADRRTVIHLGGEISAKDLLQRPSSERGKS